MRKPQARAMTGLVFRKDLLEAHEDSAAGFRLRKLDLPPKPALVIIDDAVYFFRKEELVLEQVGIA